MILDPFAILKGKNLNSKKIKYITL